MGSPHHSGMGLSYQAYNKMGDTNVVSISSRYVISRFIPKPSLAMLYSHIATDLYDDLHEGMNDFFMRASDSMEQDISSEKVQSSIKPEELSKFHSNLLENWNQYDASKAS